MVGPRTFFGFNPECMRREKWPLTLKQRADFPPAGDASFTGKLTHCRLQEKHRNAAAHKEDDVRDEEGAFHAHGINAHKKHECFMQRNSPEQLEFSASISVCSVNIIRQRRAFSSSSKSGWSSFSCPTDWFCQTNLSNLNKDGIYLLLQSLVSLSSAPPPFL